MNIQKIKSIAKTGDLLTTVSSIWVRILTAESYSHSAIVLKEGNQIYVVETHESYGKTRKILFDDWIKDYKHAYLGIPEHIVTVNRHLVEKRIYEYLKQPKRTLRYGFWTLPIVWWNQMFHKVKFQHKLNVCSTLVQYFWNSTGWKNGSEGNRKLADPGDLARGCEILYRIDK